MMRSMKRSDRYSSLKKAGISKEQILAEFKIIRMILFEITWHSYYTSEYYIIIVIENK